MKQKLWNSPINIGDNEVKNRIVYPPLSTNWANLDGTANTYVLDYYDRLSLGGTGMVVVEGTCISPEGKGSTNNLCLYEDRHIMGLKDISNILKKNGTFSSIQLLHAGGQANQKHIGCETVAPSKYHCNDPDFPYSSRELTLEEIIDIKDKFVNAAEIVCDSGFDAVEIHLSHGYLLHQFLSEYTNHREDCYGGSLEKRMNLPLEIIEGIRKKVPDLVLGARISGNDYVEGGINEETNRIMLPLLEDAGVQYFSVTAGIYDSNKLKHDSMIRGEFFDYSKYVKDIVKSPVIGVGKVLSIDQAESYLQNGNCDMVAMGRALLSDPDMVNKALQENKHNSCIECYSCMYLREHRPIVKCPISRMGYDVK